MRWREVEGGIIVLARGESVKFKLQARSCMYARHAREPFTTQRNDYLK